APMKIELLQRVNKHVFETHWRVKALATDWGDYDVFVAFVCLGLGSLLRLASQSRSVGVRAVRSANAVVLGLGSLFIFLNLHSGENNYLYPILSKVLEWSSLGPYLSLDFFF